MLLTALKMGRTSQGPETFLHSAFTLMQEKRGGQRGREQSGAVIWVILVRKTSRLSPVLLLIGEDKKWGIHIELTLFGLGISFSCCLGVNPIFGSERKLHYWERWSMLRLLFIFPLNVKSRPPCLYGNHQPYTVLFGVSVQTAAVT